MNKQPMDPESQSECDLASPGILWGGAFWHWAYHGGDTQLIVQLLREGVPVMPNDARTLANIIEGSVRRRAGPSPVAQDQKRQSDERVRACFRALMEEYRASGRYRRGMHASMREDAIGWIADSLGRSPSTVRRIVDRKASPQEFRAFIEMVDSTPNKSE